MGFLRFLLAVAALPSAVALVPVFVDVFRAVATKGDAAPLFALGGGFALFLAVWAVCPAKPVRVYILGHELTHAVWGLLFGAKVSNLKVSLNGGSVMLTKSNVLITLAPYFFPFYTMLVVLAALVTRLFVSPLPCPVAWLFAVGFTWCFHLCFTLKSLAQRQPDVVEYGHLFSWVFIWCFNVFGVVLWLWATTEISADFVWSSLVTHLHAVHLTLWKWACYCWSIIPCNR
ncbi:MAG: hypothetical protein MJ240_12985 [Kiritimatiellae bacterium]|nr:hypothetical protein [Kiritimatiellia bacterium]